MTITINTERDQAYREYTTSSSPFAVAAGRIKLASKGLAEAMEVIEAYADGRLSNVTDLFGETLTPDDQLGIATRKATEMVAIIDSRINRHP